MAGEMTDLPELTDELRAELRSQAMLCSSGWAREWLRLDDALARARRERDEARTNYRFMVERAADQKLDGYRELGAKAAAAENERDAARRDLASAEQRGREAERADVVAYLEWDAEVVEMGSGYTRQDDGRATIAAIEQAIRSRHHVDMAERERAWKEGRHDDWRRISDAIDARRVGAAKGGA